MTALRRGACPRLAAPMATGDGLLVRLAPIGTIPLDAALDLCAAARAHGNGIMEVTRRGSIQVRGLSEHSALDFAAAVVVLDLEIGDGVPITTAPLAGIDPAEAPDTAALAGALRDALARRVGKAKRAHANSRQTDDPRGHGANGAFAHPTALGPKVSIIVDGGGTLGLDWLAADIRLRAHAARWHVAVGGTAVTASPLGAVGPENAVALVARLLTVIAARGPGARGEALVRRNGAGIFHEAAGEYLVQLDPRLRGDERRERLAHPRQSGDPVLRSDSLGPHALGDDRVALGVALPFGHARAGDLADLIEAAREVRAGGVRASPGRVLMFVGLDAMGADALRRHAERLGFITRADDPRRHIAACAGAPICAAAEIPARQLGPAIASRAAALLDGSLVIHVSGCPKGCAHPGPAGLTIAGATDGCGLVLGGAAQDQTIGRLGAHDMAAGIQSLADEVARLRRPGERASDVLARFGAARVAAIVTEAGRG